MRLARIASALVALAIIGAACSGSTDETAIDSSATAEAEVTNPETTTPDTASGEAAEQVVEEPVPAVEDVAEEDPVVEEQAAPTTPRTATATAEATFGEEFPDIIGAEAVQDDAGAWRFNVTVSSPYDTPQRYADAWRVVDPDGNELGIRILAHDHANEQPFTRSQSGIVIPDEVTEVTIQGRDLINGWGGGELVLPIP